MLSIAKFDGPYESTSFTTAKYLAKDNDVYYIDNPFTWKDLFALRNTDAFKTRKPYFFSRDKILPTNYSRLNIVFMFPLLPINFISEGWIYRFLLKINEGIIRRRIKGLITQYNIKDFVFINSFNFHYPGVADFLNPSLSVYHCVDPLIVDFDRRHGIVSEKLVVQHSDLVICTSKQLYEEKKTQNKNTYFIPNAADLTHSSKALNDDVEIYKAFKVINRPIIGYFGNIERRIDFVLLSSVAKANPQKSFVLAGPVSEEYVPADFRGLPNVHFIGRIPYDSMPAVLKGFDIAIIPFKKDEVSATIFPLKLFEYLGAGKPVIATDFNMDLREFTRNSVSYCSSPEAFTSEIEFYLEQDSQDLKQVRLEVASENTWEIRLKEFSDLLENFSAEKNTKKGLHVI